MQYCNIFCRSTQAIISRNAIYLHIGCEKPCHRPLHSQSHPECAHCESHRAQLRNRDLIFTKGLTTEEDGTIGRLSLNQGDYQELNSTVELFELSACSETPFVGGGVLELLGEDIF